MNARRLYQPGLGLAFLLAAVLGACGPAGATTGPATIAPRVTTASSANPTPPGTLQPLAAASCAALAETVGHRLGVRATTDEAPFLDPFNGKSGTSCRITATGNGTVFKAPSTTADQLRELLEGQGWQEDSQYVADGPTGTATAYRQGNRFCLVSVVWEPAKEANCPEDQPISECQLTPEQKLYTVSLECLEDSAK